MNALRRRVRESGFSWPAFSVLGLTMAFVGCTDDGLFNDVDFPEVRSAVEQAPTRLEFEYEPRGDLLLVRDLRLKERNDTFDSEEIETRIVEPGLQDVETEGTCRGRLTLETPGIQVRFESNTMFEDENDRISCRQFIELVERLIADGRTPRIEATRRPPEAPQAPDDATFTADRIEIEDRNTLQGLGDLRTNVEANHLRDCGEFDGTPTDCLAVFQVFGINMLVNRDTDFRGDEPRDQSEVDVEGIVEEVDREQEQALLRNGVIVQILPETDFRDGEALRSLSEVQQARSAGDLVRARVEGVVSDADPLRVLAMDVEFMVVPSADGVADEPVAEFDNQIIRVNRDTRTLIAADSTRIRITDRTVFAENGNLQNFREIRRALEQGQRVQVRGEGIVLRGGSRPRIEARRLRANARER